MISWCDRQMMVTFLIQFACFFQSDRSRRGEQDDDPECGYRIRPDSAAAGDRDGEYGRLYGLSEPDSRTHPSGVREHIWQVEHLHMTQCKTFNIPYPSHKNCCGPRVDLL